MYNLQIASNQFQILKSTIFTATTTVIVYLLTPVLSPELPKQRISIIVFYLAVLFALLIWRYLYVFFLASHRFVQNVVLICDKNQVEELVLGLESVDPHYKIVGFVNSDSVSEEDSEFHYVKQVMKNDLEDFVIRNNVSEIVIASQNTNGINKGIHACLRK
jgi:hypothetical protein